MGIYLHDIDLDQNLLSNAVIGQGAPANPKKGQVWINPDNGHLMVYTGTEALDLLLRENHEGTQPASTISDFTDAVRAVSISSSGTPVTVGDIVDKLTQYRANYTAQAMSTAEVSISNGPLTLDGVALQNNQLFLLTGQDSSAETGLWRFIQGGDWEHLGAGDGGSSPADGPTYEGKYWGVITAVIDNASVGLAALEPETSYVDIREIVEGEEVWYHYMVTDVISHNGNLWTLRIVALDPQEWFKQTASSNKPMRFTTTFTGPYETTSTAIAEDFTLWQPEGGSSGSSGGGLKTGDMVYIAAGTEHAGEFWYLRADGTWQSFLTTDTPLDRFGVATADVDFGGHRAIQLADGVEAAHAATYGQLEALRTALLGDIEDATKPLDQLLPPTGPVNFNNQRLAGVGTATAGTDGVNRNALYAERDAILARRLDQWAAPTAPVNMNGQRVIGVGAATLGTDGVNRDALYAERDAIIARRLDQWAAPTGPVNFNSQRLAGVGTATAGTDGINRDALYTERDAILARRLDQWAAPTAPVNFNNQRLTGVGTATTGTDGINQTALFGVRDAILAKRWQEFGLPTATVDLNNQRIINVANGTGTNDAINLGQAQTLFYGVQWKDPVRVATTANITLSGLQTIDSIVLAANQRVLVKNQTTSANNGIYITGTGAWLRASDAMPGMVKGGMSVMVQEGATQAESGWRLITDDPITVGTTALTFTQIPGVYIAGLGILITGNVISVDFTGSPRITRTIAFTVGDGVSTTLTCTHNLNTTDVTVNVFFAGDGTDVDCDVQRPTVNTITVSTTTAQPANSLRVVVQG